MSKSRDLRVQARSVGEFRDAYMRLLTFSQIKHEELNFSHRRRLPKAGHEADFYREFTTVARTAGVAMVGPGGVVNEIANWKQSFDDVEMLSAPDVIEACEAVIGLLEQNASVIEDRSRTMAGRLAAFVSFPARVRAIVADEHPGMRQAAFGVGIAGQVIVGVLVGVLTGAAVALLAGLWRALA